MKRGLLSLTLLAALVVPLLGGSTQLHPMTLQSVARLSRLAFAGTVDTIVSRKLDGLIVTEVTFRDVRHARGGAQGDTVTLALRGGVLGDEEGILIGMPQFDRGARYIVLATNRGTKANAYMPIVGLNQGVFRVFPDATKRNLVHDLRGRILVGVTGNHIAVLERHHEEMTRERRPAPIIRKQFGIGVNGFDRDEPAIEIFPHELDPRTRVSEEEFLAAVDRLSSSRD